MGDRLALCSYPPYAGQRERACCCQQCHLLELCMHPHGGAAKAAKACPTNMTCSYFRGAAVVVAIPASERLCMLEAAVREGTA